MYFNSTVNGTVTIVFGGFVQQQPPPPSCHACNGLATIHDQTGRFWCQRCLDESNRVAAVNDAPKWLTAAFMAMRVEQRARLYKMLSVAFHPDTGGDENLMVALNAVREKFPT